MLYFDLPELNKDKEAGVTRNGFDKSKSEPVFSEIEVTRLYLGVCKLYAHQAEISKGLPRETEKRGRMMQIF